MSSLAHSTYRLLGAFVDELARCGLRDACTSPGSRSTPLVLSLIGDPRVRCHSHVDERCAGFFALGLAKATGLPVAIACTSGTAVAELLPAVVEAHQARVPLIVLSADRPPELREVGAGQTIDQLGIFGRHARWFFEVGTHEPGPAGELDPARVRWFRALACRAFWTALDGRSGVVHLNFPLREPLVCEEAVEPAGEGRPDGAPLLRRWAAVRRPADGLQPGGQGEDELRTAVGQARRGVLVCGRHEHLTPLGSAAAAFCERAGWALLADPMSGARRGDAAVAHYDALLRSSSFASARVPDVVLRVGDLPVSKALRAWLAGLSPQTVQLALDPERAWQDPDAVVSGWLDLEPAPALAACEPPGADPDWLADWRRADALAASAIAGQLGRHGLSEPALAAELGVLLPSDSTLFVASSMPVRDIETFWPVRPDPPRVLCNRGANGIDGTVSAAFGAAAADGGPVTLLIGDVALAHDLGGLLAARRLGLRLTIVLIDNLGGGIFDFLPVSRAAPPDAYLEHIATPTGLDFADAAALYGLTHERVDTLPAFRAALERAYSQACSSIVEVRGERADNVRLHRSVWQAVADALGD